jgi:integrase
VGKLTALKVQSLKETGLYGDGDNLYLRVQPSADSATPNKSWMVRWGKGGAFSMGLGPLRDVSLQKARELCAEVRKQIRDGLDPRKEREKRKVEAQTAASMPTFRTAAETYIETHRPEWKNAKHASQWSNTLATYAYPVIGDLPCSEVKRDHVVSILGPIWNEKRETANRVRNRIQKILDWAKVRGYLEGENPANWEGGLKALFPSVNGNRVKKHHEAMPRRMLPRFFKALWRDKSDSAQALAFCILTAARTNEVINARWSEIDFESKTWIIPADRMKKKKEHRVPLSAHAMDLLLTRHQKKANDLVFPSRIARSHSLVTPKPISNMAMLNYLKGREDLKSYTVHGFRSSFRDWAGETTDHPREVIEHALAHSLADRTEAAYQRGDYMKKRVVLMADWDSYLFSEK